MRGQRALLGLVIVMGVLILAGTAGLIGVVVHRLSAPHAGAVVAAGPVPGVSTTIALGAEPAGTRILAIARQSDTLLSIALTGGGPDRVLVWDLAANRRLLEFTPGR